MSIVARPFNRIGPAQTDRFVVASFTRQMAEIKLGLRAPLIADRRRRGHRDRTDAGRG